VSFLKKNESETGLNTGGEKQASTAKVVVVAMVASVSLVLILWLYAEYAPTQKLGSSSNGTYVEKDKYLMADCQAQASPSKYPVIWIEVSASAPVDVYLFRVSNGTSAEFNNYRGDRNFTAYRSWENITRVDAKWEEEFGEFPILVLDNRDNVHENDAEPVEGLSYSMEFHFHKKYPQICNGELMGSGLFTMLALCVSLHKKREHKIFN